MALEEALCRNDVYAILGNRFGVEFDDAHGRIVVSPPQDMTESELQRLMKLLDAASIVIRVDIAWPDDASSAQD